MAAPDDSAFRTLQRLDDERGVHDPSPTATVALGAVATVLVVASVLTAFQLGYPRVGYGFLLAIALFVVTVGAFEASTRVDLDRE